MKNKFEIFLDTDIFLDHLSGKSLKGNSFLEKCTKLFDGCYTSVIIASEIFSEFSGKRNTGKAKKSFEEVGILGIPFRYSVKISEIMKVVKKKKSGNSLRDILIIAMCAETRLPLFTFDVKRYKSISKIFKVKLISKEMILKYNSPELLFIKAKIL